MEHTYWLKQTITTPLYPELLWSRPETKQSRGKLLIIGGNSYGFSAVGEAYMSAQKAYIGSIRVMLPEAVRKVAKQANLQAEFAPSNPSGGFSKLALAEFQDHAQWADGVLLAGDFGRNSETSAVIELFLQKYSGILTITSDALDYFLHNAEIVFKRDSTNIVANLGQLQKLVTNIGVTTPITTGMPLSNLVQTLHELTKLYHLTIVVKQQQNMLVAYKGHVSSTSMASDLDIWQVKTATTAIVWNVQNPTKTFESITTSLVDTSH